MPTAEETAATDAAAKAAEDAAVATDPKPETDLGEAGKKALDAERKARADAEKRAATLQKQIDDAARAKAQADEADAEKKGEFEKLAADRADALKQREAELKAIQDERDALKERMDARDNEDKETIAKWIKDHKGAVDDFLDFYPGADAPVTAQLAWFNATRPKVEKRAADPVRGNNRPPQLAGEKKPEIKSLVTNY